MPESEPLLERFLEGMKENKEKNALFSWEGSPSMGEVIPLALQHVAAMVVGCVTPAIVIANLLNLDSAQFLLLIQAALLVSALTTFLQLFPFGRKFFRVGACLPVVMGVSFAYLPTMQAIGSAYGTVGAILGAQVVGGIVAILFGTFVDKIHRFFPPIVTGTVVFTIGLSLYPTAINYMAGGASSPTYGSAVNWGIALLVLVIVVGLNNFGKGIFKLANILIGMIVGYVVALFFGIVDFSPITSAGWFALPSFTAFPIEFHPDACLTMGILFAVNSVQAIGDLTSTTFGGMDREPEMEELKGGIIANGLGSLIGSLFGGLATATYSQNVGIVSTNRVINKKVFVTAASIILIAGFCPKIAGVFRSVPQCVIGGATLSVFAVITMSGMRLIAQDGLTQRKTNIVGLAVAMGMGIYTVNQSNPALLAQFPSWVSMVFGGSPVVIATIVAIVMNLILPKEETQTAENAALEEEEEELEIGME